MESVLEMNNSIQHAPSVKPAPKKDRIGRWTQSEAYLFETLLERHGKNWKKIHQHMKGRTLSQIRSHGQKYFGKIGNQKVEELSRRAKLLEAYETLEKQKRLQEQLVSKSDCSEERSATPIVKIEEESPITYEESPVQGEIQKTPEVKSSSEIIKEQSEKQSQQIIKQATPIPEEKIHNNFNSNSSGFLISLIQLHPDYFRTFGIEGFIDDQQFRNRASLYFQ